MGGDTVTFHKAPMAMLSEDGNAFDADGSNSDKPGFRAFHAEAAISQRHTIDGSTIRDIHSDPATSQRHTIDGSTVGAFHSHAATSQRPPITRLKRWKAMNAKYNNRIGRTPTLT